MIRAVVACLACSIALLASAGPAVADSAGLTITAGDGTVDPAAYIPRVFTVSGSTTGARHLYVKHRAAGGAPCAPSAYTDSGTYLDAAFYGPTVNGPFSFTQILTWRAPGTWLVCFWLAGSETQYAPAIAQTITVRAPAGSIGASVSPSPPHAGSLAQITVAGMSEAPRRVYAKVRANDGRPCAPTFDLDPGGAAISGWSVDGAFSIRANVNDPVLGTYTVCMWLAGSSDDALPVTGPVASAFTVVRPHPVVVSAVSVRNCRAHATLRRVTAARVRSVCMRYQFRSAPLKGEKLTLTYLTPSRRRYKTVRVTWRGGSTQTLSTAALPRRAYQRRLGWWRAVLSVDGRAISTKSFLVA